MSNQEFENYLKLIGKLLQLSRGQQDLIAIELRDHLESRISDLVHDGVPHSEAVTMALEEFGDAAAMAKNFQYVSQMKRRRWMMRFATLSTAGAFLVVIFSMSMWPSNARFGAPDVAKAQDNPAESKPAQIPVELSAATLRNMEIEQKLTQLSTFQYDEVPWQDIEEELERQFGLNILLDQTAIDDSLTADEPNSINLRNIPFEQGLSLMLLKKNAAFLVDDGIIRIISRDETDDPVFMRVKTYDCRNIIFNLDPSKSAQTIDKDKKTIVSKEDLLLDLIYSMTTNGAWTQTGGCASARIVNDILIVQHTREGHKAIETLLQDLNYRIKGFGIDGALSGSGQIEKQAKLIATATSSNEAASKDIFGDSENPTDSSDPFAEIENSDSASDDPF